MSKKANNVDVKYLAPALIRAIETQNIQELKELLDLGADPNKGTEDDNEHSPLHLAAEYNVDRGKEMVKLLLAAGANPNLCSNILQDCADIEIAAILLEAGADPNLTDPIKGWTAFGQLASYYDSDSPKWTSAKEEEDYIAYSIQLLAYGAKPTPASKLAAKCKMIMKRRSAQALSKEEIGNIGPITSDVDLT